MMCSANQRAADGLEADEDENALDGIRSTPPSRAHDPSTSGGPSPPISFTVAGVTAWNQILREQAVWRMACARKSLAVDDVQLLREAREEGVPPGRRCPPRR